MTVTGKTLREALQLNAVVPYEIDKWPYIHTSMIPGEELDWYGTDHETLYKRNLRNLPEDWIYRTKEVTYKFNDQGLRMNKNLEDVDQDYIMFCGTSYTQGLGIAEEDRFSNIVSNKLGLDFINNGGPTFTIKTHAISFFNFLKTNFHLPKMLVLEYHKVGCYTYFDDNSYIHIHSSFGTLKHLPEGKEYTKYVDAYKSLANSDFYYNEAYIYRNMIKSTCARLGIKFLEISFVPEEKFVQDLGIRTINMDSHKEDLGYCYGRDVRVRPEGYYSHPGMGLHKEASELILEQL